MQKISGTRWLNVYLTKDDIQIWHADYISRERADYAATLFSQSDDRIACVEVHWAEGQGLEAGK